MSQRSKSYTLISGNIYCAHCGRKLCSNSSVDTYKTKDGVVHNCERKYRYLCSGKAMKRNSCDGQSVYSAKIVDEKVIEALHKCFAQIKGTPREAAIEQRFKTLMSQIRQEIKKLEKENETLKRKLGELSEEIANALIGDSKFSPDMLSMAIDTTKDKLMENARKISEKQSKLKNAEEEMSKIDYYYEQFIGWADEFDTANMQRRKMIICSLFREIRVGKGYKIEILMDSSYEQFLI